MVLNGGESSRKPALNDSLMDLIISPVLNPIFDPVFSVYSYGFRPRRSPRGALKQVHKYIESGN